MSSMGAFLLSAGTKEGKRYSLQNSRIMIHQPLSGAQGGQTDIGIQVQAPFSFFHLIFCINILFVSNSLYTMII
ncbi:hypothetical protein JHK87_049634 [Glycine soja]|nr:hypothetical protein JHK87_049634 [Glycine soja]